MLRQWDCHTYATEIEKQPKAFFNKTAFVDRRVRWVIPRINLQDKRRRTLPSKGTGVEVLTWPWRPNFRKDQNAWFLLIFVDFWWFFVGLAKKKLDHMIWSVWSLLLKRLILLIYLWKRRLWMFACFVFLWWERTIYLFFVRLGEC